MQILFSCSPLIKNGHEYSHWINKVFSDCIWSVKDYFSFFIGLSSILCWLVAQLPQIILNYKTKRADSLSFIFLTEWLLGDITNLTGCILAHQLPPQTATAIYFVIIDMTLFVEFVWYRHKNKKIDQEKLQEKQPLLHSESVSDLEGGNSSNDTNQNINQNESDESLSLSGSGAGSGMSINAIMGIIGFGSITYLGIFTLTKAFTSTTNLNIDNRNLLSKGEHESAREIAGKVIGWISGLMYLSSRIPQIIKNYKRKSFDGLSVQMFLSAICGNLTYALGIFLRSTKWDFIKPKIPWLVGSVGTCGFDCTIFSQYLYYEKCNKKRKLKKKVDQKDKESDSQSDNTSRSKENQN